MPPAATHAPREPHLVHGAVHFDVDIVAQAEGAQVRGQGDVSLLPVRTLEGVPGAGAVSLTTRHLCVFSLRVRGGGSRPSDTSRRVRVPRFARRRPLKPYLMGAPGFERGRLRFGGWISVVGRSGLGGLCHSRFLPRARKSQPHPLLRARSRPTNVIDAGLPSERGCATRTHEHCEYCKHVCIHCRRARDIGTMQACKSFTTCRPPTVVARFVRAQVAAQPRRMAVRAHAGAGKAGEPRIVRGKCFVTRDVSLCGWEARHCFGFCVEEDCARCGTARGY